MVSGLIQVVAYKYFLPFYGQIHCMNMPHFAYSFHPLMDVWIVSTFDDYKQCCYKHYCALLSHVRLFITPWTHQAPMVFSRQEYWSWVAMFSSRRCLTQASNLHLLRFFTHWATWEAQELVYPKTIQLYWCTTVCSSYSLADGHLSVSTFYHY